MENHRISMWILLYFFITTSIAHASSLQFERRKHHFGSVFRGEILSHTFKFRNSGKEPLHLLGVHASCGCTIGTIDTKNTVEPGETGEITVKFDTTNFAGPIEKSLTVLTSQRSLGTSLSINANIKEELSAQPPIVDFGTVNTGVSVVKSVSVQPKTMESVAIESLDYDRGSLSVVKQQNGKGYSLHVQLLPSVPPGFFSQTITIHTSAQHLKQMPIMVRGQVLGSIAHAPQYLEFGAVRSQQPAKRKLALSGKAPFRITGHKLKIHVNGELVEDSDRLLDLEVDTEANPTKEAILKLRQTKQARQGSVHGKVTFLTDDSRQPEIEVDFYAYFL